MIRLEEGLITLVYVCMWWPLTYVELAKTMENITVGMVARKALKDVRPLFYLELPSTSSFEQVSDVPDYLKQVRHVRWGHARLLGTAPCCSVQVTPYFFAMILLEVVVRWMQGKPNVRINDSINSLSAGVVLVLVKILIGAFEIR